MHFPDDRWKVCINRYFFTEYFDNPDLEDADPTNYRAINGPLYSTQRFIGEYFGHAAKTGEVTGFAFNELFRKIFPELTPYLMSLRCNNGSGIPSGVTAAINFEDLSIHLDALLPTDWVRLHRTAELEHRRRGLTSR